MRFTIATLSLCPPTFVLTLLQTSSSFLVGHFKRYSFVQDLKRRSSSNKFITASISSFPSMSSNLSTAPKDGSGDDGAKDNVGKDSNDNGMILIDGSQGEGGGQIVRTSLTLSMITGRPIQIYNIRANRSKPGLMRQHLTSVQAAVSISNASIIGNDLGSTSITFVPQKSSEETAITLPGGKYQFQVGTAGSAGLVFQTILFPLLLLGKTTSYVTIEGGTHNSLAPSYEFLKYTFLPQLHKMGCNVEIDLIRHGFYPAGGGQYQIRIEPYDWIQSQQQSKKQYWMEERGKLLQQRARILHAKLPMKIAEQERQVLLNTVNWKNLQDESTMELVSIERITESNGPGNVILIELRHEHVRTIFSSYGKKGVPATDVVMKAIEEADLYTKSTTYANEHLADQLLLPLALLHGGRYTTSQLSLHTLTNINIIQRFLDVTITTQELTKGTYLIDIQKNEQVA